MQINAAEWGKPETLKIIVPFAMTIYALSMDVGYFAALGLGFFSLFTVTEHIGFAVQSIPAALVIVALTAYAMIIFQELRSAPGKRASSGTAKGFASRVERTASFVGQTLITIATIVLGLSAILLFIWVVVTRAIPLLIAIGILGAIASNWKYAVVRMGTIFAVSVVVAIASGFYTAVTQTTDKQYRIQADNTYQGRVLVAGERGLLVYDSASCRVKFVRWTKDVLIEARPALFAYLHSEFLRDFGVIDCDTVRKRASQA
jgi:hypothetical protein